MKKYRWSNFLKCKYPLTDTELREFITWTSNNIGSSFYEFKSKSKNLMAHITDFIYENDLKHRYERRFGRTQLIQKINEHTHNHLIDMGYESNFKI